MKTLGAFTQIFDESGRILLVRQGYGRQYWTTPGGKIEDEENPIDAAVRETLEETGLQITVTGFLGTYVKPYCDDIVLAFYGSIDNSDSIWRPSKEISELRWASLAEIPDEMSFNTRVRIDDSFARRQGLMRIFNTSETLYFSFGV